MYIILDARGSNHPPLVGDGEYWITSGVNAIMNVLLIRFARWGGCGESPTSKELGSFS